MEALHFIEYSPEAELDSIENHGLHLAQQLIEEQPIASWSESVNGKAPEHEPLEDEGTQTARKIIRRVNAEADEGVSLDTLSLLTKEIRKFPLLTREEEVDLAMKIERGDLEAKEKLINSNLRLVLSVSRKKLEHGLPLLDLFQEGVTGLIRASEKFDYRKGFKFSTYAILWIRQSTDRAIEDTGRTVRVPANVLRQNRTLLRENKKLAQSLGRTPTIEELAVAAAFSADKVNEILMHNAPIVSLNKLVTSANSAEGVELGESITGQDLEAVIMPLIVNEVVSKALTCLDDPDKEPINAEIIMRRFGISPFDEHTVKKISKELGLKETNVQHRIKTSLAKLALRHGPELKVLRAE